MTNTRNLLSNHILAADIGGSHITVGICELQTHQIIGESITRGDVDSKGTADAILTSWTDVLRSVINRYSGLDIAGLSMAMPGPFDYEKGISFITGLDKYEGLYEFDIKNYLAGQLGLDASQIRFRNDAESTIAGEVWAGAGNDYERVLGVTLGTGFGSAFSQGNITKDINLGSDVYRDSIADDYLSTRWFVKRYRELTQLSLTGGVKELAAMAVENKVAQDIFKEFAINMSDFLSRPIEHYKPDVLILCGNIAKASSLFLPQLQQLLSPLPISIAQLDEQAPLIGAASLFNQGGEPQPFNSVTQL